jgi:signal transduction histidine kinase
MQTVRFPTSRLYIVVIVSGGFCIALGFITLAGWHTQNFTLIRALPASAPMYYNTAIGFLFCGTGLLAAVCGWLPLGRVGGTFTVALGLGTLSQYLSGVDLGIDQLAMRDISGFANLYPGRMAPTTAVCFMLSGVALLLVNKQGWHETSAAPFGTSSDSSRDKRLSSTPKTALLELHGVILTVSGLMTCVLYLTGLMTAYGWGRVVNMAVPTAAGFAVLGVGLLSLAWREHRTASVIAAPWMPVLVGTAVVSATLLLCQALLVQEQGYIERATTAAAASVRSEITARMDMRILSLVRMAHHWEYAGAPPHAQWEAEATLNLRHFPGSHSIAWADPSGQVRWLVSRDATQTVETLGAALSQYGQGIIHASRTQNTVTVLPAINLLPQGKGFMVFVPIQHEQEFVGFMVGLFAFQELLEVFLKNIAPGYGVALFDDGNEVYRRDVASGLDEAEWGQETTIDPYGVTWRARVWPLPEELAVEQSALPTVTLGAGLILATLLAWMVALAQAARQRARETAFAYTELSAEMAERQRAEAALLVAHDELEQRVQERTAELAQANNRLHQENLQRQRAEESLAHQAQELARSNSELEHFAHVASHDLQEPLRKIQAFGDRLMLKCREDLGEQGRDYLERMQSAATRMQTLISDLLTFSRVTIRPRPFVSVDLTAVAHVVVSDLEMSIQRVGATVQIDQLPTIDADPGQMGQVLQNLIGNALKFHRPGVSPLIKVWGTLLQSQNHGIEHNGSDPQQCRIYIEDNGIGFEEKYLDLIFQPFQRLFGRGEYEGTGMGLAICKKIVERHGGNLTAQSTPGQGTTFIITLPTQHLNREAKPWPHVGDQAAS